MARSQSIPVSAFSVILKKLGGREIASRPIVCEGRHGRVIAIRPPRVRERFVDSLVERTAKFRSFVYVVEQGAPTYIGNVPAWARRPSAAANYAFAVLLSGARPPSYRARLILQSEVSEPEEWWRRRKA